MGVGVQTSGRVFSFLFWDFLAQTSSAAPFLLPALWLQVPRKTSTKIRGSPLFVLPWMGLGAVLGASKQSRAGLADWQWLDGGRWEGPSGFDTSTEYESLIQVSVCFNHGPVAGLCFCVEA